MTTTQTEMSHARAKGFDTLPAQEALLILATAQAEAATAAQGAVAEIATAAEIAAQCLGAGGRLIYVAAGSSGLMALADAAELPGTFGIARDRIVVLLAGGTDTLPYMEGGPEDDGDAGQRELAAAGVGPGDCVVALTASGYTPYPLAAAVAAGAAGARTIGIANNAGAPLFAEVEVGICLKTPPEVIAGSTRMGAGTAQKIALNMLSTLVAVHLGHIHDGFMVNLIADNAKLRARARGIVMSVTGLDEAQAAHWLGQADGSVKLAIVLAAGARDVAQARALLASHGERLRPVLLALAG
ncbi:MAG: N-acetylmuramic acid 6-phosphate etherase [Devosia sp.]